MLFKFCSNKCFLSNCLFNKDYWIRVMQSDCHAFSNLDSGFQLDENNAFCVFESYYLN